MRLRSKTDWETFEYHIASGGGEEGGLLKPPEYRHMEERGLWPKRHINFIVAEKVYFTVPLVLFTVYWGEGAGWKRHVGEGSKIAKKKPSYDIWTFPCSLAEAVG